MKVINLSQDMITLVDDNDFDFLSQWKWVAANTNSKASTHFTNKFYAIAWDKVNKSGKILRMSKMIWEQNFGVVEKGLIIDHINSNALDNRKENLRLITKSINNFNKKKTTRPCSSIYKGVSFNIRVNKWEVKIYKGGKGYRCGFFHKEAEAAMVYNEQALKLFGEYANLNIILTGGEDGQPGPI